MELQVDNGDVPGRLAIKSDGASSRDQVDDRKPTRLQAIVSYIALTRGMVTDTNERKRSLPTCLDESSIMRTYGVSTRGTLQSH